MTATGTRTVLLAVDRRVMRHVRQHLAARDIRLRTVQGSDSGKTRLVRVAGLPDELADEVDRPRVLEVDQFEKQLLRHVAKGCPNIEIAWCLDVTEFVVKNRLELLCRKLGANDRAHAVGVAYRTGILGSGR